MGSRRLATVIAGLALIAAGFFLAAAILSHHPHEGPFAAYPPSQDTVNVCGRAGAYVSAYALVLLGWTSLALAGATVIVGSLMLVGMKPEGWPGKALGAAAGLLALTIGLGFSYASADQFPQAHWQVDGPSSGVLGMMLTRWLLGLLGWAGTLTVGGLLAAVCAILLGWRPLSLLAAGARWLVAWVVRRRETAATVTPTAGQEPLMAAAVAAPTQVELEIEEAAEEFLPDVASVRQRQSEPFEPEELESPRERTKRTRPPARATKALPAEGTPQLPPLDLLDNLRPTQEDDEKHVREKGEVLERTLSEFNIEARVVRWQKGPVVTMYEMSLAAGTKVSRVEALADDLAIALKAPNVRVVAPIPGRSTIGAEVPNTRREIVTLRELTGLMDRKTASMAIPLFLGKDTAGAPLIVDLAEAPHLLLAGATGSGKSVAINSIITSILLTRTPQEVQMLLVDPKSVEFSDFQSLPHLMCPVLTDMKKAAAVLQWACKKMDERYSLLARVGVRNITIYNQLGRKEVVKRLDPEEDAEIDDVPFHMPHIVIVIDELGELMMVAAKEVESSIIRLSQKARAVGIHLICATQRPSGDVITGLIKANLPARMAFNVSSMVDSRVILDRNGAEKLLGMGDMLMLPPGSSRLVRAQGTYVSQQETLRIVEYLTERGEPQFQQELRDYSAAAGQPSHRDEFYDDAVRVVLETQRGSVSLLQRRLGVGYSRAARLVDMMAEAGVVGSYKGSQAREVMLTLEEWEAARAKSK